MKLHALFVGLTLVLCQFVQAEKMTWDMQELSKVPAMTPASEYDQGDIKAIFFDGPMWHGKPTRVFAYYGMPKITDGQKVPAMVLVHGGGGTAFPQWVKIWNDKGYAAIALDTTGHLNIDGSGKGKRQRDANGGPDGWGSYSQMANSKTPLADQDLWSWQAPAQIVLAHSLLRSLPNVNADRIGLTGISWGGYLTCIAASIDNRFKIAIPVYGCGYRHESPSVVALLNKKTSIKDRWIATCDPSTYLPDAKTPMLWVTGTNDVHFSLDTFAKSYRLPNASRQLAIRINMPHGHYAGWKPDEIVAFADEHLKMQSPKLIKIVEQTHDQNQLTATYTMGVEPAKANLVYTLDRDPAWSKRQWLASPAQIQTVSQTVIAKLPAQTAACYLNLITTDGLLTSTEHVQLLESKVQAPKAVGSTEDFENFSVGTRVPNCQLAAGTNIAITDAHAKSGKQSLAFYDEKGKQGWLPMRAQWFKGNKEIKAGILTLDFDIMLDGEKPGNFYVDLRDYDQTKYTSGVSIRILANGSVTINNKPALPMTPGQWCNYQIKLDMGQGTGTCIQTTEQATQSYALNVPDFKKLNWMGFVANGNTSAVTYLDNITFKVDTK